MINLSKRTYLFDTIDKSHMGEHAINEIAGVDDRRAFTRSLLNDISALKIMLEQDMFVKGDRKIGAEQEICFVDKAWRPANIVMDVLKRIDDPHFTTELAQFNMEINFDPIPFKNHCLSTLRQKIVIYLEKAQSVLTENERLMLVGILPTLKSTDIVLENMTPESRYAALNSTMIDARGGEFEFRINGTDELITRHNSVMFESCNTSFQIHYQVDQKEFIDKYNWAQAISAPVLAAATNSPLLLGNRLWKETRIALFQQSVDIRKTQDLMRGRSARVSFGHKWMKESLVESFQEDIIRFKILLGNKIDNDSLAMLEEGKVPQLDALKVHNSTIYKWNRPCIGFNGETPHIRIENRLLPAGPTIADQVANSAFWFGLLEGMPDEYRDISRKMEFDDAKTNLLKAARHGLESTFMWMDGKKLSPTDLILKELLPIAEEGLKKAEIDSGDISNYLSIIEARVESGRTGSQWMLDSFNELSKSGSKDEAIIGTTAGIYERQQKGLPVHKWQPIKGREGGSCANYFWRIDQIMSTNLYAVNQNDYIDLVGKIMDWRQVRHVPVEDDDGHPVGIITSGILVSYFSNVIETGQKKTSIKEIMLPNPVTVKPDTLTLDVIELMQKEKIGCLLVEHKSKLVGIVTEHDFVDISSQLFQELSPNS